MADPKPCPIPSWRDLPNLKRSNVVGVVLFGESCLPGTETARGCPADQAYYTIAVPWTKIAADHDTGTERAWTAPGGNRYFSQQLPANTRDPRIASLLRLVAARSKDAFRAAFKSSARLMSTLNGSDWKSTYGVMSVEIQPDPRETAAAFVARGGYLLDARPAFSAMLGKAALQKVGREPWMATSIKQYELWCTYVPATGVISYAIRVVYDGVWDQAVNKTVSTITSKLGVVCQHLAVEGATAVAAVAAFPAAAPYLAAYGAALAICGLPFTAPPCIPQPPVPGQYLPPSGGGVVLAPGGRPPSVVSDAAAIAPGGAAIAFPGGPAPVIASPFPAGTIAWRDPATPGYDIAVPFPGVGITHRVIALGVRTLPAVGIRLVTRTAWEKATLPWFRRRTSKIGLGVVGVAVAVAGTAAAVRH